MGEFFFNIDHGYLEALIRGFKGGLLNQADYANLVQCETLEGLYLLLIFYCFLKYIIINLFFRSKAPRTIHRLWKFLSK